MIAQCKVKILGIVTFIVIVHTTVAANESHLVVLGLVFCDFEYKI